MKNKKILLFLFLIIIALGSYPPFFLFAQTIEIDKITPLELARGRVFEMDIGSEKYLILNSAKDGKNYLIETNFRKELLGELKEIAAGNWEAEISGIPKGYREFTFVNFNYPEKPSLQEGEEVKKEGKRILLPVMDVVMVQSINKEAPAQLPPDLFTVFEVPPDFQKGYGSPVDLRRIQGKVSKCNFRAVIPSIELEGKPDFAVMVPGDVQAMKVVGGNLTSFKPKDVIKVGTKVEIWYEQKGDLNTARIITIQEKDIAGK